MAASAPWPNPLDDPLAVAAAGLVLVLLTRLLLLPFALALPVGAALAMALTLLRRGGLGQGRRDRRAAASIDAALERCRQLAGQAEGVSTEALARFQSPDHLEGLGLVQFCCERLQALPERIGTCRALLESGGGVLLPAEALAQRLQTEENALRRESSATLRRERGRLVEQLRRNLDSARLGMDERDARLLSLSTRLESIDGGLRHLQRQVARQWPDTTAGDAAIAQAVQPLDDALDQIETLLAAGAAEQRRPLGS